MSVKSNIDVRFSETDGMGIVYHGRYFQYFDIGREDFLTSIGLGYEKLKDRELMLIVLDLDCKYIRPLKYGQCFTLLTSLYKIEGPRLYFRYEIIKDGELMAEARTSHAFVDPDLRPVNMRREEDIWHRLIARKEKEK